MFRESGRYVESTEPSGTRAANLVRELDSRDSRETDSGDTYDEICGVCGIRRGGHFGTECPLGTGLIVNRRSENDPHTEFVHTGRYIRREFQPRGMVARDIQELRNRGNNVNTINSNNIVNTISNMSNVREEQLSTDIPIVPAIESTTSSMGSVRAGDPTEGWVLVPGSGDNLDRLNREGIAATVVSVQRPRTFSGIAFPASDLAKARGLMSIGDGDWVETDMMGVRMLVRRESGENRESTVGPTLDWEEIAMSVLGSPIPMPSVGTALRLEDMPVLRPPIGSVEYREASPIGELVPVIEPVLVAAATTAAESTVKSKEKYEVVLESDNNMEAWSKMLPVLEEFAVRLKRDISVMNAHGCGWDRKSVEEGKLRIVFWASTRGDIVPYTYTSMMWGVKANDGQHDGCVKGNDIDFYINSPEGQVVGEYSKGTLFVLFDLPHWSYGSNDNVEKLLRGIMEDFAGKLGVGELTEEQRRVLRFTKLYEGVVKESFRVMEERSNAYKKQIDDYNRRLMEIVRELSKSNMALEFMKKGAEDSGRTAVKKLEELMRLDRVVKVDIEGKYVRVYTKRIDFKYAGVMYVGHEFIIWLSVGEGSVYVKSADKLPKTNGMIHPHVGSSGVPCFGNINKGVLDYLAQLEFAAAAQLIMEYLGMCNDGDWYENPTHFRKLESVKEEELVKLSVAGVIADSTVGGSVVSESAVAVENPPEALTYWICPNCGDEIDNGDAEPCPDCGYCNECCECTNSPDDEGEEP